MSRWLLAARPDANGEPIYIGLEKEQDMIIYHGVYVIKEGMRDEYVSALRESGVMGAFRKQPGNLYYNVSVAIDNENEVVVSDGWKTIEDFDGHRGSKEVATIWQPLYDRYVERKYEL